MVPTEVFRDGVEFVRRYGWAGAGAYLSETISQRVGRMERAENFDARFGTDTTAVIYPWKLPSTGRESNPQIHPYEGTPAWLIREILGSIPLRPREFVFVDFGSGKGRALLVASEFPFAKIVGVELASELHQIAEENVKRYRPASQQCDAFSLHCLDATAYDFGSQPLVLFMYNPFGEATLRSVLGNLEASLRATPREAFVVYLNPRFEALLRNAPFLRRVKKSGAWWRPWARYVIYRAVRAGA
jgi:hypothetical protein